MGFLQPLSIDHIQYHRNSNGPKIVDVLDIARIWIPKIRELTIIYYRFRPNDLDDDIKMVSNSKTD